MSSNVKTVIILLLLCALIVLVPLLLIRNSEFSGADGAAKDAIAVIEPDYKPWVNNIVKLPGSETESMLFSLQASIGAGILGFGFGYLVCRKKYTKNKEEA